jgi:hypothetical protein
MKEEPQRRKKIYFLFDSLNRSQYSRGKNKCSNYKITSIFTNGKASRSGISHKRKNYMIVECNINITYYSATTGRPSAVPA